MSTIAAQRCLNHFTREAAARCPECGGFFCRECITEHEERIICSACLQRLTARPEEKRRDFGAFAASLQLLLGLLCAWLFFYFIGRLLVSLPSSVHEGTVWKSELFESAEP